MTCPFCGSWNQYCIDSRASPDGRERKRRRRCRDCGQNFYTMERLIVEKPVKTGQQQSNNEKGDGQMILTGSEIRARVASGSLAIEDFDVARLGPNSYNLRLAPELLVYDEIALDPKKDNRTKRCIIPPEGLKLMPGRVYLAMTEEYTETHGLVPLLTGRSSLGRLGLGVHVTAGFGDIGYCGRWTLELTVQQPTMVYPHMEICQIYYLLPLGDTSREYAGKYQGAQDVLASRLHWEMGEEAQP